MECVFGKPFINKTNSNKLYLEFQHEYDSFFLYLELLSNWMLFFSVNAMILHFLFFQNSIVRYGVDYSNVE